MSRSRDDIDRFFDYEVYIPTRRLYIGSVTNLDGNEAGVDHQMAERAIKGLHILDSLAPAGDKPINIIMNNPGGDYYHGMAIYDAIKACNNHVTIRATGYVMSMAAFILQAADERVLTPNAGVMIHYGTSGTQGHAKDMMRWAKEYERLNSVMEETLLGRIKEKHPTFSREKIAKLLVFDTIYPASEAVALGLADRLE